LRGEKTMKTPRRYVVAAASVMVIVVVGMLLGRQDVVHADDGCTDSTIAGTYGFAFDGLVSESYNGTPQRVGAFLPLAAAGTFTFDGHGNASREYTVSFGGAVSPGSDSGPYEVHSNCTGSAVFPDGTWEIVIVDHAKQIKVVNATPGIAVEGVLTRQ
jgi:hypothetical protein